MGSVGGTRESGLPGGYNEQEDFVINSSPEFDRAYLNYKSIRISKHMPKEEQSRLRRLKAQYKAEMDRLRKQSR